MVREDVLADYRSDEGEHVVIVARVRGRVGVRLGDHGGEGDVGSVERGGRFESTTIEVVGDGKVVETFRLVRDLEHLSVGATRSLLDEINALKDARTASEEVAEELHSVLG